MLDLQHLFDGRIYHLNEVTGVPGIDLIVDFVGIDKFDYVQIISNYDGSATHTVMIQLYDWDGAAWVDWDANAGIEQAHTQHSFWVPCGVNYVGTGADAGKVRVRFYHPASGNASHDLYIEGVVLYNREFRLDHHWGPWR